MSEMLSQFKKKFPRVELTERQASRIRDMKEMEVRVNRDARKVALSVSFDEWKNPDVLFSLEDAIKETYALSEVRFFPRYPSASFGEDCMPGLLALWKRIARSEAVNGFVDGCSIAFDPQERVLRIRVREGVSADLMRQSGAEKFFSDCIREQFDLPLSVVLEGSEVDPSLYAPTELSRLEEEAARRRPEESARPDARSVKEAALLKRNAFRLFGPDHVETEVQEDGTILVRSGNMRFDISNPKPVMGELKGGNELIPIKRIRADQYVRIVGRLFETAEKENYDKPTNSYRLFVSDGEASVLLRFQAEKGLDFKRGTGYILAEGRTQFNEYEGEVVLQAKAIAFVKRLFRREVNPVPRVELHCHTTMSAMDALTDPAALIARCSDWGCPAVAITDHGNVQAFPEIMNAVKKHPDVKPIYGMEGYLVDDTSRAVFSYSDKKDNRDFKKDEFVIFDIETTGLSPVNCGITQIAAVLYKGAEETDKRFETYVNPGMPIPKEITELTGITDAAVANAPSEAEAVRAFLEFCGDRMLVAHNATFDCSFIRRVASENGIPFSNPYLDTVAVSRFINADLSRHRLDVLAKYFNLGEFDHHTANADTDMLGRIFACLLGKLRANGISDTDEMIKQMAEKGDPRKAKKLYHIVLLAKNQTGLRNLYKLVSFSYLNFFGKHPRIPLTVLREYREGLLLGSACVAGELYTAILEGQPFDSLCKIAEKYDYLEVQPWTNNWFLYEEGKLGDDPDAARETLRENDRTILRVAEAIGKPVCATGDVHFLDPEDELYRQILQAGQKYEDADRETKLYLKTADEMLEAFAFLGEEKAKEIVLDNPRRIAEQVEFLLPIPEGKYTPDIPGAKDDLVAMCHRTAREMFGDPLPDIVKERMDKELGSIVKNNFSVLYIIARNLVRNSEENGYYVGSRGSVGSSFIATLARISEVNPLPPHYRCPACKHSEFITDGSVGSGFDMPDKDCPVCGTKMVVDGHNIPFETFLGFHGEKDPDIDLNFSGDVQSAAHKYTEVLFGKENIFRAGTVGTLQSKTCYGFVLHYLEDRGINLTKAEIERLIDGCVGVKRTTGQHPGGIVVIPKDQEIYTFTPVQYPADKEESGVITTHFAFDYLHETLLKLDILGHDVPTFYRVLEEYTGKSVMALPMNDPNVYELFKSTKPLHVKPSDIGCELGTLGLPEFGTKYAIQMIIDAKPQNFSDLLQISGLSHGTGIWLGNGKDLIEKGVCTIHEIIGTRDSIMIYLMQQGLDSSVAFEAMEKTRKGKGLPANCVEEMKKCGVPDWYVDSCNKIKYMFPKAHAAAYTIASLRLGWFKVYQPVAFYAAYFTVKSDTFDGGLVMKGASAIRARLRELTEKDKPTAKEEDMIVILNLVVEMYARKIEFLPVRILQSDATRFLPEGNAVRLPFSSLQGLGRTAAERIYEAVRSGRATTVDDLTAESGIGRSVVEILRAHNCLEGLPESNQMTLFG